MLLQRLSCSKQIAFAVIAMFVFKLHGCVDCKTPYSEFDKKYDAARYSGAGTGQCNAILESLKEIEKVTKDCCEAKCEQILDENECVDGTSRFYYKDEKMKHLTADIVRLHSTQEGVNSLVLSEGGLHTCAVCVDLKDPCA